MPLFIIEKGEEVIQKGNGLNWGMAKLLGAHVNINDACIAIPAEISSRYENMFPQKRLAPTNTDNLARRDHRDNDPIDIIWDDGTTMTGLLEGTRTKTVEFFCGWRKSKWLEIWRARCSCFASCRRSCPI